MTGFPSSTYWLRAFARCAQFLMLLMLPLVAAQDEPKLVPPQGNQLRPEPCGTDALLRPYFDLAREELRARWLKSDSLISTWMTEETAAGPSVRTGPIVIPVVVHVVLKNPDPALLVPLDLVQSQIDVLNRDFGCTLDPDALTRALCGDGIVPSSCPAVAAAGAPCLRFKLARRDPHCQPTPGVEYKKTDHEPWVVTPTTVDEGMKFDSQGGLDAWPTEEYLNIWVVDIAAGGALGFSEPLVLSPDPEKDGIVLDWGIFGDLSTLPEPPPAVQAIRAGETPLEYKGGRTGVHEAGHWLNLLHLWGLGWPAECTSSDLVADTPAQIVQHSSCNLSPADNSCQGDPGDDLCQDFMDYTDDAHRVLFTNGQAQRMLDTLFTLRHSLLGSHGHIPPIAGPDLWIADAWDDIGTEPDPTTEPIYLSPDIWVRHHADGLTHQGHQDPVFRLGKQFVYVRIRNRGCQPAENAKLHLYWAKAGTGLGWPAPWNDSIDTPQPMGGLIDTRALASIAAGSELIEEFEWTPPDPHLYSSFGDQAGHFSLLARIETEPRTPFGMTLSEGRDLAANVRSNNNVAWKSLWVSGRELRGSRYAMMLANSTDDPQQNWVRLGRPWREDLKALGDLGRFTVQFNDVGAGRDSTRPESGGRVTPDETSTLARTGTWYGPFELAPRSKAVVSLEFEPIAGVQPLPGTYVLDVQQWSGHAEPERLVGGITVAFEAEGPTAGR